MEKFELVATTLFGLEETLAAELTALGATDIEILRRAVRYIGDQSVMYKSNLYLRTAIKVLKPIAEFRARDEKNLYREISRIDWSEYVNEIQTIAIDATTNGEIFTHSQYVALKAKDAIVDQFREKTGVRPSIDLENPDCRINLHISDMNCSVSIDSSGVSLGKRGYRLAQSLAPISEVLAAGIIYLTGWDKEVDFIDPMCGSGTFPIEAALIANNIAPGRNRHFTFEKWPDFDATLWQQIKEEAEQNIKPNNVKISGFDIEARSASIAVENAERAGVEKFITFQQNDFLKSNPKVEKGIVVMNPPYGERLKDADEIIPFYKEIGTQLKHFYDGCDAWIISGNIEALKFIGLRPSRKIKIFNGPIECRLQKFELYRGSKRVREGESEK